MFDAVLLASREDGKVKERWFSEADRFGTTVTDIELPTVCFFVYNVVAFLLRT